MHYDQLLYSGPVALFALGGVMLWRRRRSLPTLLTALGFVAMLVAEVAGLIEAHDIESAVRANPSVAVPPSSVFPLMVHYLALPGVWLAAVGIVWHAATNSDARVS